MFRHTVNVYTQSFRILMKSTKPKKKKNKKNFLTILKFDKFDKISYFEFDKIVNVRGNS